MTKDTAVKEKILKKRSKKYRSNIQKIEEVKGEKEILDMEEAIETLLNLEQPNFKNGATVEFHAKLNINPTKSDQLVRSSVTLPHGTGKDIKIAAFVNPENADKAKKAGATKIGSDDLIEEIKKNGKIDFDIAVAEPEMMKKLPVIARILGTAGVMPSPKNQTVGENIEEMIKTIKAGKVDFKNDKSGNIHIPCGKINKEFDKEKLIENVKTVVDAVQKSKPEAIKKKFILSGFLSTSQSPSLRIL